MTILQVVFFIGAMLNVFLVTRLDIQHDKQEIRQHLIIAMLFMLAFKLEMMK